MSETYNELKRDLECMRLASDFMQMSRDTLNPELRVHCVQMAGFWSDQTERDRDADGMHETNEPSHRPSLSTSGIDRVDPSMAE